MLMHLWNTVHTEKGLCTSVPFLHAAESFNYFVKPCQYSLCLTKPLAMYKHSLIGNIWKNLLFMQLVESANHVAVVQCIILCRLNMRMEKKYDWLWYDCWCQIGQFEYWYNCWSVIFMHKSLYGFPRMMQ